MVMKSLAVVLVAIFVYVYTVPRDQKFEPVSYSVNLPKKLDGPLAINDRLEKAELLHENSLQAPEAFAVYKDQIYTALEDGRIVRITDNKVTEITRTGKNCEGQHEEHICGRPLGMTFNKVGTLYVVDGYLGLFSINVKTGKKSNIVPSTTLVDGVPLTFLNSLAYNEKESTLYFTQSSTHWNLSQAFYSLVEHDSSGRLLKYDLKTKAVTVVLKDLPFPNGVTLTHDESALLIASSTTKKILKYHIKGEKKGINEELPIVLPGEPDNITPNKRGNYWVAIISARTQETQNLLDRLSDKPLVRKIMLHAHRLCPVVALLNALPHKKAKEIGLELESLRFLADYIPMHSVIIEFDDSGKIVQSLHSPSGKVSHITEALEHNGYLYLASWRNRFVGKLKL